MTARRRDVDELLAVALSQGATIQDAADACKVAYSTVQRRMRQPDFRARVAQLRAQTIETTMGRLVNSLNAAVETLRDLLTSKDERVRCTAACKMLELALRYDEVTQPAGASAEQGAVIQYIHRVIMPDGPAQGNH